MDLQFAASLLGAGLGYGASYALSKEKDALAGRHFGFGLLGLTGGAVAGAVAEQKLNTKRVEEALEKFKKVYRNMVGGPKNNVRKVLAEVQVARHAPDETPVLKNTLVPEIGGGHGLKSYYTCNSPVTPADGTIERITRNALSPYIDLKDGRRKDPRQHSEFVASQDMAPTPGITGHEVGHAVSMHDSSRGWRKKLQFDVLPKASRALALSAVGSALVFGNKGMLPAFLLAAASAGTRAGAIALRREEERYAHEYAFEKLKETALTDDELKEEADIASAAYATYEPLQIGKDWMPDYKRRRS